MNVRVYISLMAGCAVSVAFLFYAFKGVNLIAIAEGMASIDPRWVAGSVIIALAGLVIRAIRWRLLLAGGLTMGMSSLISATFIGTMANNLLPARAGEVVRAWVLAHRERTGIPVVLASVLAERMLDIIAALAILGLCLALSPGMEREASTVMKRTSLIVLLFVGGGAIFFLVTISFRDQFLGAIERWAIKTNRAWATQGLELLRQFLEGFYVLKNRGNIGAAAGLSFLIWAAGVASFYLLAEGFHLGLTVVQTTLVFLIVLFGVAIPSAPGFVGTFHGFCVAGLAVVAGTGQTQAVIYATLLHGSQWLAVNIVGLWFLWLDRTISWSALAGMAKQRAV